MESLVCTHITSNSRTKFIDNIYKFPCLQKERTMIAWKLQIKIKNIDTQPLDHWLCKAGMCKRQHLAERAIEVSVYRHTGFQFSLKLWSHLLIRVWASQKSDQDVWWKKKDRRVILVEMESHTVIKVQQMTVKVKDK